MITQIIKIITSFLLIFSLSILQIGAYVGDKLIVSLNPNTGYTVNILKINSSDSKVIKSYKNSYKFKDGSILNISVSGLNIKKSKLDFITHNKPFLFFIGDNNINKIYKDNNDNKKSDTIYIFTSNLFNKTTKEKNNFLDNYLLLFFGYIEKKYSENTIENNISNFVSFYDSTAPPLYYILTLI